MSEVREQASHVATLRIQRGKIRERDRLFEWDFLHRRVRLHPAFLRMQLGV